MDNSQRIKTPVLFFFIFALSGFAGLIYESIWTHYLKLFLGHAAYAQTLVLTIFMGGMAIGSWICSRYSVRWPNLLLGYALAEAVIGLCALGFHPVFVGMTQTVYDTLIPAAGSGTMVFLIKWVLASLLILPQTVLLGATFPLMTAGVIRRYPEKPGNAVAMLYFTNSLGAAIGILCSGFVLIEWVGLPGTIKTAGAINLLLAAVVWNLAKNSKREAQITSAGIVGQQPVSDRNLADSRLLIITAFITGAASFIYEIGWIRLLNLVLGTSNHAFELMLSAFITGLALGGFWIRRRIDRLPHPARFLGWVQLLMGGLALATLPVYGNTFGLMQWLIKNIDKTDTGFKLFNLASQGIAMIVMLPATFCAGMTLPLITLSLLRRGYGERSIGGVYSANTVGAIAGVFLAVHVGLPYLGLKGVITMGAGFDIMLGIVILWWTVPSIRLRSMAAAMGAGAIVLTLSLVHLNPYLMASGVYRKGTLYNATNTQILFHKDGKTATVDIVRRSNGIVSINTNGKPDASINMYGDGPISVDEPTMVMAGAIPLALRPSAKTAANIGIGSGLTTQTLLGSPSIESVDTVEIEPAMVEAANYFRPRVNRVFEDPRSHIYIEDAKTFFSTENRKYDIIVSEPSNPWVSGVAGLFSEEFYRLLKRHLEPGGIMVQWVQLYEIDMLSVASILKALSSQFEDYVIYAGNSADSIIVASPVGPVPAVDTTIFGWENLSTDLARVNIRNLGDLKLRRVGKKNLLQPLFDTYPIIANSDYYPVLDLAAVRSRFLKHDAKALIDLAAPIIPVGELMGMRSRFSGNDDVSLEPSFNISVKTRLAKALYEYQMTGRWNWGSTKVPLPETIWQNAKMTRTSVLDCPQNVSFPLWLNSIYNDIAKRIVPYLAPEELQALWTPVLAEGCWSGLSPMQRDLVTLFKAVGDRDAKIVSQTSRRLLGGPRHPDATLLEYFVIAGMAGDIAIGDPVSARKLWHQYYGAENPTDETPLVLRLLLAQTNKGLLAGPS